jgi:hypothetical protein
MGLGVLEYDLANHTEAGYFDYGDLHGGEALFVPKANAGSEDDGYLLDLLMGDDDAALVVIDASTMEEVARLHLRNASRPACTRAGSTSTSSRTSTVAFRQNALRCDLEAGDDRPSAC